MEGAIDTKHEHREMRCKHDLLVLEAHGEVGLC